MANKSVYDVGVFTPKMTLKRVLILFLLGVTFLTFIEAKGRAIRKTFTYPPARTFIHFKKSDDILSLDFSGSVWISDDEGTNWRLVSDVPKHVAAALIEHPFSEDKAYIFTTGKTHYKTSDKGRNWQEFTTPIPPAKKVQVLSFHARRESYLLFRGTRCTDWFKCTDETYFTKNGFNTSPELLLENTDRCIWAISSKGFYDAPDESIFCIQYDAPGSGSTRKLSSYRLVESDNYFETRKFIDFGSGGDVRGVIGLGESQKYVVAAVKDLNSLEMKLYVSEDGQKWARAFFPSDGKPKENAYTILESPEKHLIVDVLSSDSLHAGNLFISNSNGTYFLNRLDHTNRNKDGLVDFKHLQSVDGILIANIVSNYEEINNGSTISKKLQSKISFDDGDTWRFIKPPEKFLEKCEYKEQEKCSLHLHSMTSGHNNGRVFSTDNAPGVLMGVGSVGPYLLPYDQCDTFLSYDGGMTWRDARLGAHLYGIGHYGTILVLVDDEQPTEEILYSFDRGESWEKLPLDTRIRAKYLTTNSKSKNFLLWGSAVSNRDGNSNNQHYIFKLDFSNLFERDCDNSDFETWTVERPGSGSDCFMGRMTSYRRRRAEKLCFIASLPDAPDDKRCPCTKKDFECDFNYIFDKKNDKCIPLVPDPDGECKDGERKKYKGRSGYRLIQGNDCDIEKPKSERLDEPITKECSGGPPLYGEVSYRTYNFSIDSYFYFPESTTLIIKTTDGKVKKSKDEGSTWEDALPDESGPIAYMFLHDHDKTKAYFFPDKYSDKTMWYTTDSGETFSKTKLQDEPNMLNLKLLDFHPTKHDWLLFMAGTSCPECHSITYFSSDNGKSWKEIETWADKCIFRDTGFETDDYLVFCSSYKYKDSKIPQDVLGGRTSEANPLQLVKMKTDGGSKEVLLSGVVDFFIFNEFMAVATEESGQLLLHVSEDGKKFSNATFPPNESVKKQAYTILPSATGSIFLDVYKSLSFGFEYGSLFKSNSDGVAFSRILDNTNRNLYGNVDFEKVQGLDGIIIANQVENANELSENVNKKVISKISYDDGSHWKRLEYGDDCQKDCYLNLHGRTDIRGPGGIYSSPSSIGLLIGVGNVGPYLLPYNKCNTFMSRDGGRTWAEIRRGASLYEFGDQGTIIVVVDDEAPTDHILYSWNYGKEWNKHVFTSTPVRASLLTTNSNSTSLKFLLLGHTFPESDPVFVTFDFSQLEKEKCKFNDDFELWDPMDKNSRDHRCLLGEKVKYWRRKADKICHIGESHTIPEDRSTCSCTKHDFECANGYWRNDKTGNCELMGPDPDRPANCQDKYKGHSGYVKMKKSKCKGGENLDRQIEKDCKSGNIITSKTNVFKYRFADYVYFNEANTILALTMDNIVWQSTDEGHTWKQIELLENQKIYAIYQNPYFNKYAYLITLEKTHFYTSDSGANFKKFEAPEKPNIFGIPILNFHPDKPEYLIYTGSIECEDEFSTTCRSQAFYTSKNGNKWKDLEVYVRVCQWARSKKFRPSSEDMIICESYRDKEGSQRTFFNNPLQLVSTTDFFKRDKNKRIIKENTVGTAIFEEFIVVAELLPSGQSLRLWASADAESAKDFVETLAETHFPPNMQMTQNAFTVLESVTRSIILHVTTSPDNKYGNILRSDSNGVYYSLSLSNANRDNNGFVDFERMRDIEGIAVANVVSNVNEVNMGIYKKLKSMITFNDGASWRLLKPPTADSNNRAYDCVEKGIDNCSLHLHSYTERRNKRDSLSSSSAIGLMMGVGNVGDHLTLYSEGDTFLSRDAGLTWTEVKKGAYMYEFGDQGSIIVLADDEHTTDHILYSLNEGLSWQEYKFTKIGEQPIRIFDIDTIPGGLSSKFILRGFNPSRINEEIVVYLDFTYIFERKCESGDFEEWKPGFLGENGKGEQKTCLFGEEITYFRKKQTSECYITDFNHRKKEKSGTCKCTKEDDYECGYNFMRSAAGDCTLYPGAEILQPNITEQCANDDHWFDITTGYRLLRSTKCEGGFKPNGEEHDCPRHHSVLFWIIIVLLPFVVVGILTICLINRRHGRLRGYIRLPSSIEHTPITDILYQIRMPRFVSRLWSNIPLPGRRNRYRYSPVATNDGEVLMDDYDQDNEAL